MVSVCIATYNGEKYIKEQISSILSQIHENDEIIVSDDKSSDKTVNIIKSFNDNRIKIFIHKPVNSFLGNFENAIIHSKGDFIFLSDQDDVWLPTKYEKMLPLLQKYDLVCSNSKLCNEHLDVINPDFFNYFNSGPGVIKNMIRGTYFGSCMAFRRSLLKYALPFPPTIEVGHDRWLGIVSEIVGKSYFYKEPLLLYRQTESSITGLLNPNYKRRSYWKMFIGRIIQMRYVFSFFLKYKLHLNHKTKNFI